MIRVCSRCGAEITVSKRGRALYCDKCRRVVVDEQKRASRERLKNGEYSILYKPVKRVCEVCGSEYEGFPSSKYCALCRIKVKREQSRHRYRKPKTVKKKAAVSKPVKTLEEWIREADECNMDYGTYRSLVEKGGMTFEEIKALDLRPVCHSHCRAARKMI